MRHLDRDKLGNKLPMLLKYILSLSRALEGNSQKGNRKIAKSQ